MNAQDAPGTRRETDARETNGVDLPPEKGVARSKVEGEEKGWRKLQERARALKEKMERDILERIEKIEDFQYKNARNADAIRQKIQEDWGFFESEIQRSIEGLQREHRERKARIAGDVQAKKQEMDRQFKQWEQNYQEWSSKTRKNMKETLSAWSISGWKFYLSFLAVVVPIVIIIVVLANALR